MRLYPGRVPVAATDIIQTLIASGDIEVSNPAETQLDVEAVLREYLRQEREIGDRAKDILESRGLGRDQFGRVRRLLSEERGLGSSPEETAAWIANQLIEVFMHSPNVEEVFADDGMLRVHIRDVLKRHMAADEELDVEVRKRLKNLEEGTTAWEVEYQRAMADIKRAKGLE